MIRHGQTDDNRRGVLSGRHNNTHLTREGIRKAVDLQDVLPLLEPAITHSTSSSLERAQLTEFLATHNLKVPLLPSSADFDERDYEKGGTLKTEGAEPYEDHQARVVRGINRLLADVPDGVPLVVCHGGTIRRAMDAIGNFQKSPDYTHLPNTGVFEFVTPSREGAQDWQINVITMGEKGIERRPVATNLEMYRRRPDEPRGYNA